MTRGTWIIIGRDLGHDIWEEILLFVQKDIRERSDFHVDGIPQRLALSDQRKSVGALWRTPDHPGGLWLSGTWSPAA